jgi:hypothetical protein
MEAAPRFELGIKDLQSHALPLGYAAIIRAISILPSISANSTFFTFILKNIF